MIFDNASFHVSEETLRTVGKAFESKRVEIYLLPPYSPTLNPIEQLWRELKKLLKESPTTSLLYLTILTALKLITQKQVLAFYRNNGY